LSYIGNKPANKAVVASDLDPAVITGQTALGATPADTDEFIISDAGVLKRMDYSHIKGGGKVLQVVEGTHATALATTSTSYVTTNLDVDITPSATSSKILVICTFNGQQSGSDYAAKFTLYRDSTDLSSGSEFGITRANVANIFTSIAMTVLDSPSSTSAITYAAYIKNGGSGTSTSCTGNSPGRIIAMEIGA